jgi:hypothetical protein
MGQGCLLQPQGGSVPPEGEAGMFVSLIEIVSTEYAARDRHSPGRRGPGGAMWGTGGS